jgi:8-oxo-dGTP pyrophosphatase MutT (NUDIX family)
MHYDFNIEAIKEALKIELPGINAHKRMAPPNREIIKPENVENIFTSAVLLLIFPIENELHLCLTRRTENMKNHPGQISFPGGRCEIHEKDPVVTALRETHEEIGIDSNKISIIGKLSDVYIPVSKFIIHPYVGFSTSALKFRVNKSEVDQLIVIKLSEFINPDSRITKNINTTTGKMDVPCYFINGHVIWGATSMMIAELEAILTQYYSRRGGY